jgi:hypothetical protein
MNSNELPIHFIAQDKTATLTMEQASAMTHWFASSHGALRERRRVALENTVNLPGPEKLEAAKREVDGIAIGHESLDDTATRLCRDDARLTMSDALALARFLHGGGQEKRGEREQAVFQMRLAGHRGADVLERAKSFLAATGGSVGDKPVLMRSRGFGSDEL